MGISDYKTKDVPVSIIIITITHQNEDAWRGNIFSAQSISTTNAEMKNYFQLVQCVYISNMYQSSDQSALLLTSSTPKW